MTSGVTTQIKYPNLNNFDLAYETGFHIGDANMFYRVKYASYRVGYYGNNISERKFYEEILLPLLEKLFGIKSKVKNQDNTCYIRIFSKNLVRFKQKLGLPIGNKSQLLKIPKFLRESQDQLRYFIAGLFDSDGCVKRIKREQGIYPRLNITLKNEYIIKELSQIFPEFGISSTFYREEHYDERIKKYTVIWKIDVNGYANLKKFLALFPIKNLNHLERLKVFSN
jgi:flagellar protein FlaI